MLTLEIHLHSLDIISLSHVNSESLQWALNIANVLLLFAVTLVGGKSLLLNINLCVNVLLQLCQA